MKLQKETTKIMIKFEKVSFEEFAKAVRKNLMPYATDEDLRGYYDDIQLPKRGSKGSAGYDFFSPVPFELRSEDYGDVYVTIPLGVRAVAPEDMFLMIVPRSGVGFKTGAYLANTVGIIDSDYIISPNEGHIMIRVCSGFNNLPVHKGDRLVQGIFLRFYTTDDDDAQDVRKGGFGSTGV